MEKFKKLDLYQRILLITMALMIAVFSFAFGKALSRKGFDYRGRILVPRQEDGLTVWSGSVKGREVVFAVSEQKGTGAQSWTVTCRSGSESFGPYTVKEDLSAVPRDKVSGLTARGVEVRSGSGIMFRGGIYRSGGILWLYSEDGSIANIDYAVSRMQGVSGGGADASEPLAAELLELIYGPGDSHRGDIRGLFLGIFICVMNSLLILFADDLFRWNMSFRIKNADRADPSEWELFSRSLVWTLLTVTALAVFIVGLK